MQALAVQRLRRLTLPLLVMSAWALRQLMQNQVERHRYRLWPRLRQLLVPIGLEMSPSRAALVRRRLKLVPVVQPLAVQRLSRLTHPLQVMPAWALRPLMQNQLARHQYRL